MNPPQPAQPHNLRFHHGAQGQTTKFWIFPDGKLYDTNGNMHFRWAQAHADFLSKTGNFPFPPAERRSDDEQAIRVKLIKQGFFRVNHIYRTNALVIEGLTDKINPSILRTLRQIIAHQPDDILTVTLNRFDREVTIYHRHTLTFIAQSPEQRDQKLKDFIHSLTPPLRQ